MDNKMRYQRIFLIFSPEDTGYGIGQEPSGYVKMEVHEGKGKLLASVQNLNDNRGICYKVYIFRCMDAQFSALCAGQIPLNRNRGELRWEFNAANVDGTGIAIQDFNVVALIGEGANSGSGLIICPLAAYKDGKVAWREKFRRMVRDSAKESVIPREETEKSESVRKKVKERIHENEVQEVQKEEEVVSRYNYDLESKYVARNEENSKEENSNEENSNEIDIPSEAMIEEEKESTSNAKEEEKENPELETSYGVENSKEPNQQTDEKSDFDEYREMLKELELKEKQSGSEEQKGSCQPENTGFCRPIEERNGDSPCKDCKNQAGGNPRPATPVRQVGSIEKLRINLDKFFETYDPFRSRRRDYRWWKVGSPVQLNNILYQCNIKTPLLFNPALMMAHFKYRHLIVGIYSDRARRKEYIVCGVPGVFNVDEKPFGNMCRWAQVEGSRPRYGAFGYWLIYIDAQTGKFLSVG